MYIHNDLSGNLGTYIHTSKMIDKYGSDVPPPLPAHAQPERKKIDLLADVETQYCMYVTIEARTQTRYSEIKPLLAAAQSGGKVKSQKPSTHIPS